VKRRNAQDDMIKRYFSECTSLLQKKGYLTAEQTAQTEYQHP